MGFTAFTPEEIPSGPNHIVIMLLFFTLLHPTNTLNRRIEVLAALAPKVTRTMASDAPSRYPGGAYRKIAF